MHYKGFTIIQMYWNRFYVINPNTNKNLLLGDTRVFNTIKEAQHAIDKI
jgi:hypothetical protein